MGECSYFFKMQFKNKREAKKALKPIGDFLRQMREVHDSPSLAPDSVERLHGERDQAIRRNYEKDFPLVADYLEYVGTNMAGGWKGDRTAWSVSVGGDGSPLYLTDEDTIGYAGYDTWHLEDWTPLMGYLGYRFGPIRTGYASEENGCAGLDSLNLYDWEGIVRSLLKRKALLPALLRAHKDLDELLSHKMK